MHWYAMSWTVQIWLYQDCSFIYHELSKLCSGVWFVLVSVFSALSNEIVSLLFDTSCAHPHKRFRLNRKNTYNNIRFIKTIKIMFSRKFAFRNDCTRYTLMYTHGNLWWAKPAVFRNRCNDKDSKDKMNQSVPCEQRSQNSR